MADTTTKKSKSDRPAPHDFPSSPATPSQDPEWEQAAKPDLSPEERMQGAIGLFAGTSDDLVQRAVSGVNMAFDTSTGVP